MGRTQNYEQSTIYHIRNIVTKEIIYVGSTTNFPARKYRHKSDYNRNCNLHVYCVMRENGGFNQYEIIPIRILNLKNKTELLIAENEEQDRINLLQLKPNLEIEKPVLEDETPLVNPLNHIIKPNLENEKPNLEIEKPVLENERLSVNPLNHIIKPNLEIEKPVLENERLSVCNIVKPNIENVRVKNEIEGNSRYLGIVENVKPDMEIEKPDMRVKKEIEGNSLGIVEFEKPLVDIEIPSYILVKY